jgi:predicted site-specific integrase-resolvase
VGRKVHGNQVLLDAEEVTKKLSISRRTLSRLMNDGALQRIKLPGDKRAYFEESDVAKVRVAYSANKRQLIAAQDVAPAPSKPAIQRELERLHPGLFS